MRERPILFSGPMVRAILAGTKTQTRRVAKPVRHPDLGNVYTPGALALEREPQHVIDRTCPYGQPGDRLWVRATWNRFEPWSGTHYAANYDGFGIGPDDDPDHIPDHKVRWRPSIHMPRAACRLVLEVTGVRVERLQDMTLDDLCEEGISELLEDPDSVPGRAFSRAEHAAIGGVPMQHIPEMYGFAALWDSLNGSSSWSANPWVWVVEFRRAGTKDGASHA